MKAELVVKGKLVKVSEPQVKSEKFTLVEIVVNVQNEHEGKVYDNFLSFQVAKKQLQYVGNWKVGADCEIKANVSGRKWTNPQGEDKYFNTLEAYFIKCEGGAATGNAMQPNTEFEKPIGGGEEIHELPF
jgi:hypothetical protein